MLRNNGSPILFKSKTIVLDLFNYQSDLRLHFSLAFDGPVFHAPGRGADRYVGPQGLLHWLEMQCGLGARPENIEYLRIERYRQALSQYLSQATNPPFYKASFEADRFACAAALLDWRDELLLAGWDFQVVPEMPDRLRTLAELEKIFQYKQYAPENPPYALGFADRFETVLQRLSTWPLPLSAFVHYEALALLPPFYQRLIAAFEAKNIPVLYQTPAPKAPANTNLGQLQRRFCDAFQLPYPAQTDSEQQTVDSSLLVLRMRRDSDAAVFAAQLLRENTGFRPLLLHADMNFSLELALRHEGFAPIGALSASLARPALQVLKLAPLFLWEPMEVYKLMEFFTLPIKPLDAGLCIELAKVLSQKPGLFSDNWFAALYQYLEQAEQQGTVRDQYDFWFDRKRYPANSSAPRKDMIDIYDYLRRWALDMAASEDGAKAAAMPVLAEQARRICALLEALPEPRLSYLELERIVRTIYEPAPAQLSEAGLGHLEYVQHPGAVAAPASQVMWWNCIFSSPTPPPERWQQQERQYLAQNGVRPQHSAAQGQLNLLLQYRAVLECSEQLLLMVPEFANGAETPAHLLLGDIEAAFPETHRHFSFHVDQPQARQRLAERLHVPKQDMVPPRRPQPPTPILSFDHERAREQAPYETPTNLESLFYYPHRWFFKQKLKLAPLNLLSISAENTLLGNLAHRFFEMLFQENWVQMEKKDLDDWIKNQAPGLLEREGATLLLYGREPEKAQFLNKVKNAAWALLCQLRDNHWSVQATEFELNGSFAGVPVRGKADLVLQRGGETAIVDLKWRGLNRRKAMIMNGEDLQLVLYSRLLAPEGDWPHSAYFILEDAKMIARNSKAFKDALVAGQGADDHQPVCNEIYERMLRTYEWRMQQLAAGKLEIRHSGTAGELEELYAAELGLLLELPHEDAKYDDYKVLIG